LITIALNVPSGKYKKKDIIKVENRFLKDDDTNKLAVIAPSATVNIIKDYKLVEKRRVSLPNEIERIFRCSNPDCVTNSSEHIESVMDVIDKDGRVLRCRYCNRLLDVNQLKYR
jgi:aspartate carbamoyltransferase regulatory subunit